MKKRLRKKKRVGEFQEFGFGTGFRFSDQLTMQLRKMAFNTGAVVVEVSGMDLSP